MSESYTHEDWVRLGSAVRQRRHELNLSQPGIAAAGGPSVGVLSKLENGKLPSPPGDRVLISLDRALGWTVGSCTAVLRNDAPTLASSSPQDDIADPATRAALDAQNRLLEAARIEIEMLKNRLAALEGGNHDENGGNKDRQTA
ncbi:helix-turn-helix domain-containing protein [Herbidospora sp. NEAU-GS84]|uniref:Helix-turn-helix domain-containing protein n=1 Tax=Herbidospora solisilvae TaxID=2696284 RepID=A0A7C9NGI0_9ACTN|nr:helix-turn-helix transcriptional regulator [Herbidospora solisilvae]NAS22438.1 helix-turn-helix domain-containing protein [Herbidospora solisilvae]